jgi:hypothetical protein
MRDQPAVPRSIHIHVERVTLHGYSPSQQARFTDALQTHLTQLAASEDVTWPAAGERIRHLDAGVMRAGAQPEEAAHRVAARLLAAITNRADDHDN